LAARGKLVEQDPNQEPAGELLKRIQAAKSGGAPGKRRGLRDEAPHSDCQETSRIPDGWARTTLGVIATKITDGTHKTPAYVPAGIPFVSVKDFSGGRLDFSNTRFISVDEHELLYRRCDPRRGDILIGRIGTLGKAVVVDTDSEFSLFVSVGLIRFDCTFFAPEFLRLLLNSPLAEEEFNRIKIGGATHTNKLNLGDLQGVALPLAPLA
jgi:type I restriction enzyme S subunit